MSPKVLESITFGRLFNLAISLFRKTTNNCCACQTRRHTSTRPLRVGYVICVTNGLITINFTLDNFSCAVTCEDFGVETLEHKSFCSFVSWSYLFTCLHNVLDKWLDTISVGKKTRDHLHRSAHQIHGQESYVHTMILKNEKTGCFHWILLFWLES